LSVFHPDKRGALSLYKMLHLFIARSSRIRKQQNQARIEQLATTKSKQIITKQQETNNIPVIEPSPPQLYVKIVEEKVPQMNIQITSTGTPLDQSHDFSSIMTPTDEISMALTQAGRSIATPVDPIVEHAQLKHISPASPQYQHQRNHQQYVQQMIEAADSEEEQPQKLEEYIEEEYEDEQHRQEEQQEEEEYVEEAYTTDQDFSIIDVLEEGVHY
jgi:hypothetical protein